MVGAYLFKRYRLFPFLRGFIPLYTKSQLVSPMEVAAKGKKLVWRNQYDDTLKITSGYADKPVELGNFLFLRTRERNMLHNRIYQKKETVKYDNFYTTGADPKQLLKIESELHHGFESLNELMIIMKEKGQLDFPVSFAANALYALEKNGLRNEKMYESILYPILRNKAQYLHSEGLAGAIWALGQVQSTDADLIVRILDSYNHKKFGTDVVYVNNAALSNESFVSADGSHGMEFDSTKEFSNMYFKDHIVCLELYEGLKNLSSQALDSAANGRVSEVLKDLEEKQNITSDSYWFYKQISGGSATPSIS